MANRNCLKGMACPRCKSEEPFEIGVETTVQVWDAGAGETGDLQWDEESDCRCVECGHAGRVADFRAGHAGSGSKPLILVLKVETRNEWLEGPTGLRVELTPRRLQRIRCLAALVREHNLAYIEEWDYSPAWGKLADEAGADDWEEPDPQRFRPADPEDPHLRVDLVRLVVSDRSFRWTAHVKHTDIPVETDPVEFSDLPPEV